MEELLKEIEILNYKLKYYEENNKSKKTIFFIHGFNSSTDFIKNIIPYKKSFNVIALNLPGSKYCPTKKFIKMSLYNEIVDEFISKNIKTKKLIVLGHSLGGAIASFLHKHKKVKEIFFMGPLNPSMVNDSKYKLLKKIIFSENKRLESLKNSSVFKVLSNRLDKSFVSAFLSENSVFRKILKDEILSEEFLLSTLDNNFVLCNRKKETHYLIGKMDQIINPKLFEKYVNEKLQKKVDIFTLSMHNIIKNQPKSFVQYLNQKFDTKKNLSKRKLIKK